MQPANSFRPKCSCRKLIARQRPGEIHQAEIQMWRALCTEPKQRSVEEATMQPRNTVADFNKLAAEAKGSTLLRIVDNGQGMFHGCMARDWQRTAVNQQCVRRSWGR